MRLLVTIFVTVALALGQAMAQTTSVEGNEEFRVLELCSIVGVAQGIYEPLPLARAAASGHCNGGSTILVRVISPRNEGCNFIAVFRAAQPSPDADWDGLRVCDFANSRALTS
jgi:hypothetical protein